MAWNPDIAQFFRGYGVRPGGKAVERDLQFWIDVSSVKAS